MDNGFQSRLTGFISTTVIAVLTPLLLFHLYRQDWLLAAVAFLILGSGFLLVYRVSRGDLPVGLVHAVATVYTVSVVGVTHLLGVAGSYWAYPVLLVNFYVLPLVSALVFNIVMLVAVVWLMLQQPEVAMRVAVTLGLMTMFNLWFSILVAGQRRELSDLSLVDPLTRARNRRALDEHLIRVSRDKARHHGRVAAIMLDIDHFKAINDRFDHNTGDAVLKQVVRLIAARLRATDSLYRYGGEEFVIIAEHTGAREAQRLADDLRQQVMDARIDDIGVITVSAGVAELCEGEQPMAWLSRADEAMYLAKRQGRNRVCAIEPECAPAT